jgi:hypothetical protein
MVYAFRRKLENQEAVVVFNAADETATVEIPLTDMDAAAFMQAWPAETDGGWRIVANCLEATLPPRAGLVLVSQDLLS